MEMHLVNDACGVEIYEDLSAYDAADSGLDDVPQMCIRDRRKDIASEKITDEEGNKQTVWNCDERQIRVAFAVTEEEVTADFDSWWRCV